jgi:4-amino-4-deoxy-L-arabinose transferase-like glycosyltransferase
MGLQSIWGGGWIAVAVGALLLAIGVATAVSLLRPPQERPRGIPTAAWLCALVGLLNAACWSIVSPPFQAPDEPDHLAYVQLLAETGETPQTAAETYSPEQRVALRDLRFAAVRAQRGRPVWADVERRRLDRDLGAEPSRRGPPNAGVAAAQPPLYYLLAAVPARAAAGQTMLHRLALLRVVSVLLAGVTALLAFLFVRELLPGAPWAWSVGGLAFALQPVFGFASSAVNPDALMFAISAAVFYCLARAFRRGLTLRLSAIIGLLLVGGFWTKLTFAGLVGGGVLALLVLTLRQATLRQAPGARLAALRLPGVALAVMGLMVALVAVLNVNLWERPAFGAGSAVSGVVRQTADAADSSLGGELLYIWQLYLPRLPGMSVTIEGVSPVQDYVLRSFVGVFGWAKIPHPEWVYTAALIPALIGLELLVVALVRERDALRRRAPEAAVYAVMALGLLVVVGAASYSLFLRHEGGLFQARYLLPLGAPFAAALALAARGAGRRWGPAVGALIVLLVLTHLVYSQLLVISAFYG